MNIHESCLALIRVDSRFQRTLNRTCVQMRTKRELAGQIRERRCISRVQTENPMTRYWLRFIGVVHYDTKFFDFSFQQVLLTCTDKKPTTTCRLHVIDV